MSSAALTLGRSRGVALLGRPLDVAIPLTLDAPGQASELCPEADLFHGDTRVVAARVTARIEPGTGLNAVVRIQSSMPVDEPVVTVYLRIGCSERFTRRFVLLTEEPAEIAPFGRTVTPAPLPLPLPVPSPARPAAPETRAAVDPAPVTGSGSGTATTTAPRRAAPARKTADRSRRFADAPMTPRGGTVGKLESELPSAQQRAQPAPRGPTRAVTRSGRPRLTIDMLDLTPERDAQLRSSPGLAGAPSTDEQVRAQAAALWRSINAQPEDVLRDLQRVQALENDVKGLRGLVASNDRTLSELRGQLNQAQQDRTLTLAAIALLALLLAATVVTWWLRRGERGRTGEWWRRQDAVAETSAVGAANAGAAASAQTPARAADMDLRVDESMFESLKKPPRLPVMPSAAAVARPQALKQQPPPVPAASLPPAVPVRPSGPAIIPGFQNSSMASMRMVKAEELVDIQQQADFFMSLGQADQAIEVLESHIHSNAETSALVWLDLLAIYRALKRRDDYELLRTEFQRVFNGTVPAYDSTPTVSRGLEDYPRALSRIAALWPSPKVMDVIEESIFRKPGMHGAEPFDLEAYRELVMLYNLGREVVGAGEHQSDDGDHPVVDAPGSIFNATSMQQLSVVRQGGAEPYGQDSRPDGNLDSIIDSTPGNSAMDELESMHSMHSMLDSDGDQSVGQQTTTPANEFIDPQVPRPSPRLGLDIDLTTPDEPARHAATDSGSIDFELFETDPDIDADKPGKAG